MQSQEQTGCEVVTGKGQEGSGTSNNSKKEKIKENLENKNLNEPVEKTWRRVRKKPLPRLTNNKRLSPSSLFPHCLLLLDSPYSQEQF